MSVNRWFRAAIVARTAAICASKSFVMVVERAVSLTVMSVRSSVISWLKVFVRSSLMSAMIWSLRALAFVVLLMLTLLVVVLDTSVIWSPVLVCFGFFFFGNSGNSLVSNIKVWLYWRSLKIGDLFH